MINFPFGTNGKLMVLGVPILKHFRVAQILYGTITAQHELVLNDVISVVSLVFNGPVKPFLVVE